MGSINHCFFCNTLLVERDASILKCLHIICKKCEELKRTDTRVRCKCDIITEGELLNYPNTLYSDNIGKSVTKICNNNNCNELATEICITCNQLYCRPCSKVHLEINNDHHQNLMMSYPFPEGEHFVLCSNCKVKYVEVKCTQCNEILCSLCHLSYHGKHKFKLITTLGKENLSDISIQQVNLEKNNKILNKHIKIAEQKIDNLEIQKIKINEEIDNEFELLHKEIDKRMMELKNSVNVSVTDTALKIKDNINILKELEKNNTYLLNIAGSIVKHDNIYDIINLSQITISKLDCTSKYTSYINSYISDVPINIQFVCDESMKNIKSSIKEIGNIITPKVLNLPNIINPESLDYNCPPYKNLVNNTYSNGSVSNNEEIPTSFGLDSLNSILPVSCACCNQWSEKMIKCSLCKRLYHNTCHIPLLNHEHLKSNWECTICYDISKEFKENQKSIIEDIYNDKSEWKIIERILMELYCQNSDSEFLRNCPNKIIYPDYYEKVSNPISLNDIKKRLESSTPYSSIIDFIFDVKRIFSNVKLYYPENDPYYKSGIELEKFFNSMLTLWIPELHYVEYCEDSD